ncbi:MAG: YjbE family putative metal transport protein [Alphaproteobacteria bacterium]|nr:YjbE family putative metal transport protein [Alphaproteobacteria bacterium]
MIAAVDTATLWAFAQVIMIDLVLAGDNAVVIGMAAAGLPASLRRKAILYGILGATVMRIALAMVTMQLLAIVGLLLAGGLLLLWVSWKLWEELHATTKQELVAEEALADADLNADGVIAAPTSSKTFGQAITQIMIADLTMSLDNVLAVAGAAREHPTALVFGLALSIALMGLAAAAIARLLTHHRWIAYVGLLVIVFVAFRMIVQGAEDLAPHTYTLRAIIMG